MKLKVCNACFTRFEDDAWVEGVRTWRYGSRSTPRCPTMNVLHSSGLLNFFWTSPMWANVRLLEFMINYWDHDLGMFDLQGESLEIALEDIYFIADLSRRGDLVNLEGTSRGGDPLSVYNYIDIYCAPSTQKRGSCIPIMHIRDLPLQVLTSTIVRVAWSS